MLPEYGEPFFFFPFSFPFPPLWKRQCGDPAGAGGALGLFPSHTQGDPSSVHKGFPSSPNITQLSFPTPVWGMSCCCPHSQGPAGVTALGPPPLQGFLSSVSLSLSSSSSCPLLGCSTRLGRVKGSKPPELPHRVKRELGAGQSDSSHKKGTQFPVNTKQFSVTVRDELRRAHPCPGPIMLWAGIIF